MQFAHREQKYVEVMSGGGKVCITFHLAHCALGLVTGADMWREEGIAKPPESV